MAFQSNSPVVLALPPFRGVTRKLVLAAVFLYFALAILWWVAPLAADHLFVLCGLSPARVWPWLWQPLTYSFVSTGLLGTVFALLSVWFFGYALEDAFGSRWLTEFFCTSTILGGCLAAGVGLLAARFGTWLSPGDLTFGMWPAVLAILVAYASFFPEQRIQLMFVLSVKAKYVAAIYLLLYLALALRGGDRFSAVTALFVTLCGWLYLRLAPRRGLAFAASETWFGWRNAFYRAKRKRAAKKFTVYMRKQGKDVNIDSSGRYIDLDSEREGRSPNDKRWMN